MIARRHVMVLAVILALSALNCLADQPRLPFLHPLFSDNMVLQRDAKTPVWGWTTPGAEVAVELDGKTARCKAGADGKWLAELPPHKAGGPFVVKVTGPETVTLKNVLLGDVWLCSGQSNMEMGIRMCFNGDEEVAAAANPEIRLFTVPKRTAFEPVSVFRQPEPMQATWLVCSPETAGAGGWGGFSAVGYFFGRDIQKTTKLPVGLIHSSWGGTIAEAWTSAGALKTVKEFKTRVADFEAQVSRMKESGSDFEKDMKAWLAENDPGTRAGWEKADLDTADWKTMDNQPKPWEGNELADFDGLVWFRRVVELPEAWAGAEATLSLAMIDDTDTTYVNGEAVGGTDNWQAARIYKLRKGLLKTGRNVIAVRVLDTGGGGGFHGKKDTMNISAPGQAAISLAGTWQYKVGGPLSGLKPVPRRLDDSPNQTTVLFNGMIAPLLPYAIKGALWYQGESNAGEPMAYRGLLPAMIKDWRKRFGVGDFPFFIVQLASYMEVQKTPVQDKSWALIRESQYVISRDVPNCGLAAATDIGDAVDIHPRNKQEVGRRLALLARAKTYGEKIVCSGPVYKSMKIKGNEIILKFDNVAGGLVTKGDKLTGFAIAGNDGNLAFADARIVDDTVIVSAAGVPSPKVVYYAWANNPVCNLFNSEGLPAVPFRTKAE